MSDDLTIEDLERISGLPLRTLRFYMQEGLLQGPDTHGKNARYSQQHVDRLELIQHLKGLRLPLQEIRQLLENMTPEEIARIRRAQDIPTKLYDQKMDSIMESPSGNYSPSNALDYIQQLEQGRQNVRTISKPNAAYPSSPMPSPLHKYAPGRSENLKSHSTHESWSRVVLSEGIELNIRQPGGTGDQEKIQTLIDFAHNLFGSPTRKEKKK